jgi:cell division protease FtsH
MIGRGYDTAKGILGGNHDTLVRIALALLEREVLDANEIKLLVEGKDLPDITPPPKAEEGVQQVLKPEPGRPGLAKGGESPARA